MQPYGTRIGGWLLGLVDTIAGGGDFTPDGRQAFVIRSPWGIGLMRVQDGVFQNLMLVPHGTDFGSGWIFSNEDAVLGTFPMTYGQDRILLRNSNGVASVYFDSWNGFRPRVAARLNDGQRFSGAWWFNRNDVIVTMGGDINNDGYGEFVIRSAWGIGVIDASLAVVAMQPFGARAPGGWLLGVNDQIVGFAGVAGGQSLVIQSPWGLGFLGPQGGSFVTRYLVPYGVRFPGGWLFGRRDRIAAIGNIDAAHAGEELVIRSAWGFGVLRFDTGSWQLLTHGLWPYGTNFGGWTLARTDFIPAR
jgi:hypothetical protein